MNIDNIFSFIVAIEITNDFELKISMNVHKGVIGLNKKKQFKHN